MRTIILWVAVLFSVQVLALDPVQPKNSISNVMITQIKAYEKTQNRYHAVIKVDSSYRTAITPMDMVSQCRIWINNKVAYKTAMHALINEIPVKLVYTARRNEDTTNCQLKSIELR